MKFEVRTYLSQLAKRYKKRF